MTIQEYRQRLKAAHLCRDCKKQDAYTLSGRTRCAECAEREAEAQRKRRKENPEYNREAVKRYRAKAVENGMCVRCCTHKRKPGRKLCEYCLKRIAQTRRAKQIANGMNWPRGANCYCWQCNKRKAVEGKRMCQECIDRQVRNFPAKRVVP